MHHAEHADEVNDEGLIEQTAQTDDVVANVVGLKGAFEGLEIAYPT